MPVLTIPEAVDLLRGRFHRCRYLRNVQDYDAIAAEIGLSRVTLYRFGKGGPIKEDSLYKIEQWCQKEEDTRNDTNLSPFS